MSKSETIIVSAPAKVHLLGEHAVVYGKPAILTSVNLRVKVTISPSPKSGINSEAEDLRKIIEAIIKKGLKIKTIPIYKIEISSQIPIGSGLGSSAAVSASYIAALLTYLKVNWNLELINKLAYEAEKVFHGNPSGGDNSTVTFGGLVWYRKETPELKIIKPIDFTIPKKMARNFLIIQTGKPNETTLEMVAFVKDLYQKKPKIVEKFLINQEQLVRDLLLAIKNKNETELMKIIHAGEKNLESIKVVSPLVKKIIRQIEKAGGVAKICGGGGRTKGTGVLLAYHPNKKILKQIAKENDLNSFQAELGVEGLRKEE